MATFLRSHLLVATVVATGALLGCSKKPAEPKSAPVTPVSAKPADDGANGGMGKLGKLLDPKDPRHGTRKLIGLDTPVYVDGEQVAVLRYGEMPTIPTIDLEGGAKRYRVYDYLKAVGIDVDHLKSIHFHGNGDRIASVEASELLKAKDKFQFQFSSGTSGGPIQEWDTEGLKNTFVTNEIRRMTVYVKKASPAIDPKIRCHLGADGECTTEIPYSSGATAKGTRVYFDGKMVGFVKRRLIGDALAMGDTADGEHKFSLAKLVAQMGADPSAVNTVELVAGDSVVGRATGEAFNQLASNITFTLPQHDHGKVRIHVPSEMQAKEDGLKDQDALVSSVLLYKNTKPVDRELIAISQDTDLSVQLAAMDDAREKLGRGER